MHDVVDNINSQLDRIEALCTNVLKSSERVSKWSVGQHLEHMLLAISGMSIALRKNHPGSGDRTTNTYRELVMKSGKIPRGVVQAPAVAQPSDHPDDRHIGRLILKTRNRFGSPLEISESATLIHPIMETMTRDEALTFMVIHNDHHLAIIADILAQKG